MVGEGKVGEELGRVGWGTWEVWEGLGSPMCVPQKNLTKGRRGRHGKVGNKCVGEGEGARGSVVGVNGAGRCVRWGRWGTPGPGNQNQVIRWGKGVGRHWGKVGHGNRGAKNQMGSLGMGKGKGVGEPGKGWGWGKGKPSQARKAAGLGVMGKGAAAGG